jgi:DNA-binding helix-hairpin-helix protein with protein kinase domain
MPLAFAAARPAGNACIAALLEVVMILRTCDSSVIHIPAICGTELPTFDAKRIEGKTTREAIRCLKRYLARHVWRLLQPPHPDQGTPPSPSIS